jgi:hypothetical protein
MFLEIAGALAMVTSPLRSCGHSGTFATLDGRL